VTSLERAKSFLERKARVIALTAVPLASLVAIAPAKAGMLTPLTLNTVSCSASVNNIHSQLNSGGSCSVAPLPTGSNGITGVTMSGSASATGSSGGGNMTLTFQTGTGTTNNGDIFGVIPIDYDFSVSLSSGGVGSGLTWSLTLDLNGTPTFTTTGNAITSSPLMGILDTTNLPTALVTSYSIIFTVNDPDLLNGQTLTVNIPADSSIDINANAVGVAPEPGTFALLGFALAALGSLAWWRRRSTSSSKV
jgi:PEP-CTERM motif